MKPFTVTRKSRDLSNFLKRWRPRNDYHSKSTHTFYQTLRNLDFYRGDDDDGCEKEFTMLVAQDVLTKNPDRVKDVMHAAEGADGGGIEKARH